MLDETLKMEVTIVTENEEEKMKVGEHIHNQLVGNQDYIDSNIVLNIDTPNTVILDIFKECKNIPTITI